MELEMLLLDTEYPPKNAAISHLGKKKIIVKYTLGGDLLVPRKVLFLP